MQIHLLVYTKLHIFASQFSTKTPSQIGSVRYSAAKVQTLLRTAKIKDVFFDMFTNIGLPLTIGRKTLPHGDSRDYQDAKRQAKRA